MLGCPYIPLNPRCSHALVLSGTSAAHRTFIPRIPLSPSESSLPVKLVRRQFPVKRAWAMSINKAQGQTFVRFLPNLF